MPDKRGSNTYNVKLAKDIDRASAIEFIQKALQRCWQMIIPLLSGTKAEVCGLSKGNIKLEEAPRFRGRIKESAYNNGDSSVADIFNSYHLVSLTRNGKENFSRLVSRDEFWTYGAFCAWCHFCKVFAARAVEGSYVELADDLMGTGKDLEVGADIGAHGALKAGVALGSFPQNVSFPWTFPLDLSNTLQRRGILILLMARSLMPSIDGIHKQGRRCSCTEL